MSERDPMAQADTRHEHEERRYPPTLIGWAARLVSLGLVAALLAVLAVEITQPTREVGLKVEPQWNEVRATDGSVLVPVEITNSSTQTIREMKLELDGGIGEPVHIDIALMGEAETLTYVAGFPRRPKNIAYRIVSYQAP